MGFKSRVKSGVAACAMIVCLAGATHAENLTDALVLAYNNSDLLDQNRAVLRAADEDVATAVAALRPTLDYRLRTDWGFFDDSAIDVDTVRNTIELTSQLSIYEGGRNRLAIEAAKESVLAARESLVNQEQQVMFSAVQAYLEIIRALEFVDLRKNNVRVLQEEVRAARDRFEVGEVTRTDVAQAESRLALAEANLVAAEGDYATAREQYNLAVGQYPGTLAPTPRLPLVAKSPSEARTIALRAHPQILQAQHLVRVAETNMARAEAAVLPALRANVSAGLDDSTTNVGDLRPNGRIGLEISGPIYRGGALNSAFRSAAAQRDQTRAQLLRTTSVIDEQVGIAWATLEVAQASLLATERQIEAARIAFEGTREEATLGARTTLDVLNAEQELLNAQANQIDARAQEQLAAYGLLSTMGLLTVEYLKLPVTVYDPSVYYNSVRNAPGIGSKQGIQLDRVLKGIGKY